jgi:alkanesulfonate monooxygenase SsuD/methylene tetrahydromethanopterin reductase-like flavin-dependent oxidoreductase (luciferase family)
VRFGLMLDNEFGVDADLDGGLSNLLTLTETARDLGFSSVFVIHHYLAELPTFQAISLLGRLSAVSGSMRVGTGVLILPLLEPVHVAEEFASLDQLARGGAILGVGAGYREDEFSSFGISLDDRASRLAESTSVIRQLWSGAKVTHHGAHHNVVGQKLSMRPRTPGGPPIWVGAAAPKTVKRAASFGDAWVPSPGAKTKWAIGNLDAFMQEKRALGFDTATLEAPIFREVYVGDKSGDWESKVGASVRQSYGAYVRYDLDYFEQRFDELRQRSFVFGTPDEVTTEFQLLSDSGFTEAICRVGWLGTPLATSLRTLELLATEVMPRFQ